MFPELSRDRGAPVESSADRGAPVDGMRVEYLEARSEQFKYVKSSSRAPYHSRALLYIVVEPS